MDELVDRLKERIRRIPAVEGDAWCVHTNEAGLSEWLKKPWPEERYA